MKLPSFWKKKPEVGTQLFSFGDPIPVLDQREFLDYMQTSIYQDWYEPPLKLDKLAKSLDCNSFHSSSIRVKNNILSSCFIPHPLLSYQEFDALVMDFLLFGNCYLERIHSRNKKVVELKRVPAYSVRRGVEDGRWFFLLEDQSYQELERHSILQIRQPSARQEIYGKPEYLSALNACWLGEAALLFRRKYYINGSHAGFILYVTNKAAEQDVNAIRDMFAKTKGLGNFKNLFVHAPGGEKEGVKLIPINEVTAKDEFYNVQAVTRDAILAAHRVPPAIMGIIPMNTAGFGDAEKAAAIFARNELQPLQMRFSAAINGWLGKEIVTFKPYSIDAPKGEPEPE